MSGDTVRDRAIAAYEAHSGTLRERYDAVVTEDVLGGVLDLLPPPKVRMLDVGAGSGRDAVWFAEQGYAVTAAEPVAAFRAAIAARLPEAEVADGRLPHLESIAGSFGLILVNAVWHHLSPPERAIALDRLSGLLTPGGRLILSLRHGPLPEGLPVLALDPDDEIARAAAVGLKTLRRVAGQSHQQENIAAGVTWTWLVFEKEARK